MERCGENNAGIDGRNRTEVEAQLLPTAVNMQSPTAATARTTTAGAAAAAALALAAAACTTAIGAATSSTEGPTPTRFSQSGCMQTAAEPLSRKNWFWAGIGSASTECSRLPAKPPVPCATIEGACIYEALGVVCCCLQLSGPRRWCMLFHRCMLRGRRSNGPQNGETVGRKPRLHGLPVSKNWSLNYVQKCILASKSLLSTNFLGGLCETQGACRGAC